MLGNQKLFSFHDIPSFPSILWVPSCLVLSVACAWLKDPYSLVSFLWNHLRCIICALNTCATELG